MQPLCLRCKACEAEAPPPPSPPQGLCTRHCVARVSGVTVIVNSLAQQDQSQADRHNAGSKLELMGAEAHLKSVMEKRPERHRQDRRCSASSLSSRRSMSYRLQQGQVLS